MSRVCELTGKTVLVGNTVSHANNRHRTRFLPNLGRATLFSESLGRKFRFRVAASALRTVEKNGGLDAYLLKAKPAVLSARARKLKRELEKSRKASA